MKGDKNVKYKPSPIDKYSKPCVHEVMKFLQDGTVKYEKWIFYPSKYPCGKCDSIEDTAFMRTSPLNEVMITCFKCNTTQPVTVKNSKNAVVAEHVVGEDHIMTLDEVAEFIKRNKVGKRLIVPERILDQLDMREEKPKPNVEIAGLEEE